jgi:hypothetical protein
MNWIAGLNYGTVVAGKAYPYSMIYGVGNRYHGTWTKIPGTICNGYDADPQFTIQEPLAANDVPAYFTDEDWITHGGAWLSALARIYADSAPLPSVERKGAGASLSELSAYPNPFNPSVTLTVRFKDVTANVPVLLQIFTPEGRLIRTYQRIPVGHGACNVTWDGKDARGVITSSGVYFFRLRISADVILARAVLAR